MKSKSSLHGLGTLTRQCTGCRNTLSLIDNFNRCDGEHRENGWKLLCKECELDGKVRTRRKSSFDKIITQYLKESHELLLDEALAQDVEETCPIKLRAKFPYFTDKQVTNMARLNEKWNAANDFLIEEQYFFLNPKERTSAGIEYKAELFISRSDYEEDQELADIRAEQVDIDDQ